MEPNETNIASMRALTTGVLIAGLAAGLAAGLLVGGVAPASAHANHVSADAQVSANGTVVLETLYTVDGGFVVIHADDGGEPGRPIGHRALDSGFRSDVPVEIEADYWSRLEENATVHAVLHRDANGNGAFDPGTDEQLSLLGRVAGTRFAVRKGTVGATRVTAAGFSARRIDGPSVTVRRVALVRPGSVVVSADDDGSPGAVVGRRALNAGVHENVTVALDSNFYANSGEQFRLWATAHTSDEEAVKAGSNSPAVVNGTPVGTIFLVRKSGNAEAASLVNTATSTPASGTTVRSTASTSETRPPATASVETAMDAAETGEPNTAGTAATPPVVTTEEAETAPPKRGTRDDREVTITTEIGPTEPESTDTGRAAGTSNTSGSGFGITVLAIAAAIVTTVLVARSQRN